MGETLSETCITKMVSIAIAAIQSWFITVLVIFSKMFYMNFVIKMKKMNSAILNGRWNDNEIDKRPFEALTAGIVHVEIGLALNWTLLFILNFRIK